MNTKWLYIFIIAISLNAQTTKSPFKAANGKPLANPKVISSNPSGLMVKHKKGVRFIKFPELPEDIRKKYNYDPQKAKAYEKSQADIKAKAKVKLQKKLIKANTPNNTPEVLKTVGEIDQRIKNSEARIKLLQSEIKRIDIASSNFMNTKARRTDLRRDGEFSWQNGKLYMTRGSDRSVSSAPAGKSKNFIAVDTLMSNYRNEIKLLELELVRQKKRRQELLSPQTKK
jgi:hypothetical protein